MIGRLVSIDMQNHKPTKTILPAARYLSRKYGSATVPVPASLLSQGELEKLVAFMID